MKITDLNVVVFEEEPYKGRFGLQNPFTGYILCEPDGTPRNYKTQEEATEAAHCLQEEFVEVLSGMNKLSICENPECPSAGYCYDDPCVDNFTTQPHVNQENGVEQ